MRYSGVFGRGMLGRRAFARNLALLLLVAAFAAACTPGPRDSRPSGELGLGVDTAHMDREQRPQDDFFRFVNGGWLARSAIPSDRARWGAFDELRVRAENNLHKIVEEVSALDGVEPGSPEQMIRDFYLAYMDEEAAENLGLAPLESLLAGIDAIADREQLIRVVASLPQQGVSVPVVFFVRQDAENSDRYISYLQQSGLGLPDRDYYLNDDPDSQAIRDDYIEHITQLLSLAGDDKARQAAQNILQLETELARHQWTRVQNRNPVATYNRKNLQQLAELSPELDWDTYIRATGAQGLEEMVVRQPDYLAALGQLLASADFAQWQSYLRWQALSAYAPLLSSDFADAHFDFYSRRLRGIEQQPPRWERAVEGLDSNIGFQLGKLYVARHFAEESRERMAQMVDNLLIAFAQTLRESPWMSEATREEALDKLSKLNTKIGFPEQWRDYSGLIIKPDDLVGNYRRARAHEHQRMIDRLGEPVDRGEWFMTPQTVNAYYSPSMSEIVFPAAILMPPFFNVNADDAVNYGAIGAVIGHEISHAFDDSGRQVDGDGNLRDWWSPESAEEFQRRAQVLVDQYSAYEPVPGMPINGELTLGENIADHGGLRVAWRAYQLVLAEQEDRVIDGFTSAQRFFLGWGQVWRTLYRDEALRQHLQTRPHSPAEYRVNGTLRNIPAFYQAFDVQPGDGLYLPEGERADVW